ncbi:MAG: DUF3515 domain-containing protein [Pseudonocardiaceae bacterium]
MSKITVREAGTGRGLQGRLPVGIALVLVVALVVAVLLAAAMVRSQPVGPLGLAVVPAPAADSAACARLLAALPETLDGGELGVLGRRQLSAPIPPGAAGWGEPPVVLRCGLDRPTDLTATSRLLSVSGVQFLEIPSLGMSTWAAVDRPAYVAVTLPPGSGSGPLQQIAGVVSRTLPAQEVNIPH